jgi:Protein of unknown function (DUF2637)
MLSDQARRGPDPSGITRGSGRRLITGGRRRAGTGHASGSVLIAVAAWLLVLIGGGALFVSYTAQYTYILAVRGQDAVSIIEALLLDLLMIVFALLALGLSEAGQPARAERVLIVLCAVASSYMNVSAADVASRRSVTAYAVAPLALAVAVDRTVAVIRRHVLADREPSAWATVGRAATAAAGLPAWWGCTCCGSRWPPRKQHEACARWCWMPPRCPHSSTRPRLRQPSHPGPRRPSCSPCTAPTRTTETAAQPAGSPPS